MSPTLSATTNGASARGLELEEPSLSFSDLIRPLSATPSPEPSLHFGTPSRKSKSCELEEGIPERRDLYNQVSSSGEEDGEDFIDDSKVAEMRETVIAWGLCGDESGFEQSSSSRERQLAMMVTHLIPRSGTF